MDENLSFRYYSDEIGFVILHMNYQVSTRHNRWIGSMHKWICITLLLSLRSYIVIVNSHTRTSHSFEQCPKYKKPTLTITQQFAYEWNKKNGKKYIVFFSFFPHTRKKNNFVWKVQNKVIKRNVKPERRGNIKSDVGNQSLDNDVFIVKLSLPALTCIDA